MKCSVQLKNTPPDNTFKADLMKQRDIAVYVGPLKNYVGHVLYKSFASLVDLDTGETWTGGSGETMVRPLAPGEVVELRAE